MTTTRIIDRIDARLKALGLSGNEAQRRAGLPLGMFSQARKSESGVLTPDSLAKLAPILDTTVATLMGLDQPGPAAPAEAPGGGQIVFLPLDRLGLSPKNERTAYDEEGIAALAEDIGMRGLLQNLVVYPSPEIADFDLVAAGGRRWRALNLLAIWHQLPADIATHGVPCRRVKDEAEALVATIVENMRREDVHFLDRAAAFARLRDELGWSNGRIGEAVNVTNDSVGQYLRIHDRLPADLRAAARRGEVNFKQARELVAEKKAPAQVATDEPPTFADEVKAVLGEYLEIEAYEIAESDRLVEDLRVPDHHAKLIYALRERFDIPFGHQDIKDCAIGTVGDLVRHILAIRMAGDTGLNTPLHLTEGPEDAAAIASAAPAATAPDAKVKRPGEVAWPYGFGCMAYRYSPAGLERLVVVDRRTGKEVALIPEQCDIEDPVTSLKVHDRVTLVLNRYMGEPLGTPIAPSASLEFDLELGSGDAVHIGQALAVEFFFVGPPYLANADEDVGFAELGFDTVGDLVTFLEKRLAAGQRAAE